MARNRNRKGKSKRHAAQKQVDEPEEIKKAPHSFVLYRGQVGKHVAELMKDFRKVMEPYTASQLKVLRSNQLKDFITVAGVLNVTHMVMFTKSSIGVYMRIIRLPHGPTLTFRVMNYSVARDVISSLKRPLVYAKQYDHHPLMVLNNFSGEGAHMKLMATTFQNMFPSINVHKVKLNSIRRTVLLNYNSEDNTIDFRHYTIKVVPTGLSKGVKKLIQNKVPNLGHLTEMSDFMINGGNLSESEAELDGPANQVTLPQNVSSRGNAVAEQSAIRLVELGPRIKLCLVKIEDGVGTGEVLYHNRLKKTPEEIEIIRKNILKKRKLKEKRLMQQQQNIKLKAEEKQKKTQVKRKHNDEYDNDEKNDKESSEDENNKEIDDGHFRTNPKKRDRNNSVDGRQRKKMRLNDDNELSNNKAHPKKLNHADKRKSKGKVLNRKPSSKKNVKRVTQHRKGKGHGRSGMKRRKK